MRSRFFVLTSLSIALVVFASLQANARNKPLKIIDRLDVQRYSGTWYELARLPNWFERKCSNDVTATYSLNDDGTIAVSNQCMKTQGGREVATGLARLKDPGSRRGYLKVTFAPKWLRAIPAVWADYCILYLDQGYRFALIGEPQRKYLWILARERTIEKDRFDEMIHIAVEQGYDVSKLIRNF